MTTPEGRTTCGYSDTPHAHVGHCCETGYEAGYSHGLPGRHAHWDCNERGHLPLLDGTCQACRATVPETDRTCRKARFDTLEDAELTLADVRHERGRPKGRNVRKVERRAYLCPKCGGYHLTSQP